GGLLIEHIRLLELSRDCPHFCLSCRHCDAGLEPSQNGRYRSSTVGAPVPLPVEAIGHPKFSERIHEVKTLRQYSDHFERSRIEFDLLSDDVGIFPKAALP